MKARDLKKIIKYILRWGFNALRLMIYIVGKEKIRRCDISDKVNAYVDTLRIDPCNFEYSYSVSSLLPTLYGSVYACLTYGMTGRLGQLTSQDKALWVEYFDSHQDHASGLFVDPRLDNRLYREIDWWGARHITLHMVSAYTYLGARPAHRFSFLDEYRGEGAITRWLGALPWEQGHALGDIDNQIMNVGCALQYERDAYNCDKSRKAVDDLKDFLIRKRSSKTLLWGDFNLRCPMDRSRAVQFAYHLYAIFFYDDDFVGDADVLADNVLATQTVFGGFGALPNTSACEDIDSIDILISISNYCSETMKLRIDSSLKRARSWVLRNQVGSGGFVFRHNERFIFGSNYTSSLSGEAGMLGTWFRLLSLCHLAKYFSESNNYGAINCQGYDFI